MDLDMTLMDWFYTKKDEKGNIVITGQEINGNTFTIRTRRSKEIKELIKDLERLL